MRNPLRRRFTFAAALTLACSTTLFAQDTQDNNNQQPPAQSMEIFVTATKTAEDPVNVPSQTSVVTGDELRRKGVQTLGEALQDVAGVDTGNGSDNGARLPNIGFWGLKEFDALLILVDGVPVGGPFNPNLAQIPMEDIDRIEIAKGPQGSVHGVSAFAGVVQIFTRREEQAGGSATVGGGSFSDRHASAAYSIPMGTSHLRFDGSLFRAGNWQDRTDSSIDRGSVTVDHKFDWGAWDVNFTAMRYNQEWGSPTPFDAGQPVEGFLLDRNYAIRGAHANHHSAMLTSTTLYSLSQNSHLENVLGLSRDNQSFIRSFVQEFDAEGGGSEGIALDPRETSLFDDLRYFTNFKLGGDHRLVAGASITNGQTKASGIGFDFEFTTGPNPDIPSFDQITPGDHRSFDDKRNYLGAYLHDEWSPVARLTVSGGARYDKAHETLNAKFQEVGSDLMISGDRRTDSAWSGDGGAVFRIVEDGSGVINTLNLYGNVKSSFKPAAPNLTEAEDAEILNPERTHSREVGLKSRFLDRQLEADLTYFHMNFENLVVSILGQNGEPQLVNAGKELFKGEELEVRYLPKFIANTTFRAGIAHHVPRFVQFTFVTPDGELRDVSGKQVELAPRQLWNADMTYAPAGGIGGFFAVRQQGTRPMNRRNTQWADAFTEWDAGLSYYFTRGVFSITGHNLGDDRHVVSESDIGDAQFYFNAPRRVTADFTYHF